MWTKLAGDVNETPADRAERFYANRPKSNKCGHCHTSRRTAKEVCCTTCGREMCEDCISHDPEVGPVCGLCYDRKYDPEVRAEYEKEDQNRYPF